MAPRRGLLTPVTPSVCRCLRPLSLQSQAEVRSLLAAAEAEVEAIKEEGGRRLEDCTAGLREKLGEAEEALQVRVDQSYVARHFLEVQLLYLMLLCTPEVEFGVQRRPGCKKHLLF